MTVTYHRETHHNKCSKCLLLALRHAIKQSGHSIDHWSSAGCWPYFRQMPFQLMDIPRWFFGCSQCLQVMVHWWGFHAARSESEWCIGLLLWCLAAQTVAAIHLSSCWRRLLSSASGVRKSTELLWHKTPNFTPDVAYQQTRPQFCRLQITESHSGMRLSETARDAKHSWWALVINRMIFY